MRRFGSHAPESGILSNALARARAASAEGGSPPHEGLVFGMAGGIGFHHVLLGAGASARIFLDGRSRGLSTSVEGLLASAAAFAVPARVVSPKSAPEAENVLVGTLEEGAQALVWADLAALPPRRLPRGYAGAIPWLVAVTGFDEDGEEFEIDDGADRPIPIDAARLQLARAEVEGARHRMICLDPAPGPADLGASAIASLRTSMTRHRHAPIGNRGTAGMRSLAGRLRKRRDRRGWMASLGCGGALYHALAALYRWVEHGSTGPALGRELWVAFLSHLGERPGCAHLGDEAEAWLDIAARWQRLAESAMPRGVRRLLEPRQLMETKYTRYRRDGLDALPAIAATNLRLGAIAEEMEAEFPLRPGAAQDLLDDLAVRLDDLAALEEAAADRLLALTS